MLGVLGVGSRCVYGELPATTTNGLGRWRRHHVNKCSPAVLHASRLQVLWRSRARSKQIWHEDPKEGTFLAVTAEGFASTLWLGKRGALTKRRCPVAGVLGCGRGPGMTMGFRDLDATKAVHELPARTRTLAEWPVESLPNKSQGNCIFLRSSTGVCFKCLAASLSLHRRVSQSRSVVWQGRTRGERSRLREERVCWGDGGGGPPPFLHADSELAGVSPAVSAQS